MGSVGMLTMTGMKGRFSARPLVGVTDSASFAASIDLQQSGRGEVFLRGPSSQPPQPDDFTGSGEQQG